MPDSCGNVLAETVGSAYTAGISGKSARLGTVRQITAAKRMRAVPMHWHRHHGTELLLVLSGEIEYDLAGAGARQVHGGMALAVGDGTVHRAKEGMESPAQRIGLLFSDAGTAACDPEHAVCLQAIRSRFSCPSQVSRAALRYARILFGEVSRLGRPIREWLEPAAVRVAESGNAVAPVLRQRIPPVCLTICERMRLKALTELLLAELADEDAAQRSGLAEYICGWLDTHFRERLSVQEIAGHFNCSRTFLFDTFRKNVGLSPMDYIQRKRVEEARNLLSKPGSSVTDVAFSVGFSSSQYFAKVFRKYTGKAPGEFLR